MNSHMLLSDTEHPQVRSLAIRLTEGKTLPEEKLKGLFFFVRDEIKFGFPPKWDAVKASETLSYGRGYCTTKATLMVALCRASGIPARIHTGLIEVMIMRGIFPDFVFPMMPELGGHSWTEIKLNSDWKSIDSYINDQPLYERALVKLHQSGDLTAFSISEAQGGSSSDFNFGEKGFVHMGAVKVDHGVWEDYSVYMASDQYIAMDKMQQMSFPLIAMLANRNLEKIRRG